jgi:hypothetical protein
MLQVGATEIDEEELEEDVITLWDWETNEFLRMWKKAVVVYFSRLYRTRYYNHTASSY